MSASDIMSKSGTAYTPTTAFAAARQMGHIPRGLQFDPNDGAGGEGGGDGGTDGGDDGSGDDGGSDDGGLSDDGGSGDATVSKTQHDAVLKEMIGHRTTSKKFEKQIKDMQVGMPSKEEMEEFRNFRVNQQKAEEERQKKEGQFDKMLREANEKHATAVAELKEKLNTEVTGRREDKLDAVLSKHIPAHTTVPVDDVAPLVRSYFKWDEDGDMVIDVNGEQPMNTSTGQPQTPAEFIAGFIESRPHLAVHRPKGGSGGRDGKGKGSGKGQKWTAEDIEQMSQADFDKNEKAIMEQMNG